MSSNNARETYRTDPAFRVAPWRPVPTQWDQALEAARDDPTDAEFINILASLPDVFVHVDGDDEDWRPTVVSAVVANNARTYHTDDVVTIARRAGWQLDDIEWTRDRLEFVPRGESE